MDNKYIYITLSAHFIFFPLFICNMSIILINESQHTEDEPLKELSHLMKSEKTYDHSETEITPQLFGPDYVKFSYFLWVIFN